MAQTKTASTRSRRTTGRSRSNGSAGSNMEERYRRAAEDALQQLDWAIGYLHGIRKRGISKALAQNRAYIRRRLLGEAEQPLPVQKTDET